MMKRLLLLLLLPIFQWYSSQITFDTYTYSFGPDPYTAHISGQGTIYYTTDGTDPTVNSSSVMYNLDLSISAVTTVKAMLKNLSGEFSPVFTKKYYFGPFPHKTVYFKKPPTWTNVCSFSNSYDPELALDIYSGPQMTPVCEGWYSGSYAFFVGSVTFDNCIYPQIPPVYQHFNIVTEDTVYYDYSEGPITNPPACVLAVSDPTQSIAVLKFFPNPVTDFITIESDINFQTYEIIDLAGKSCGKKVLSGKKIEASTLPAGIYLLRLTSSGTVTNFVKFIKK